MRHIIHYFSYYFSSFLPLLPFLFVPSHRIKKNKSIYVYISKEILFNHPFLGYTICCFPFNLQQQQFRPNKLNRTSVCFHYFFDQLFLCFFLNREGGVCNLLTTNKELQLCLFIYCESSTLAVEISLIDSSLKHSL